MPVRHTSNSDLPPYLYHDADKGYRLTLIDGKRKSLGKDRTAAIAIAMEYNRQMRFNTNSIVSSLIMNHENGDLLKPFSRHLDNIHRRILEREDLGANALSTLDNDMGRAKHFFTDVNAMDITLRHVKEYLDTFHGEASGNVRNRKTSFLEKIFDYAIDEGIMNQNPAKKKLRDKKSKKIRKRLSFEKYKEIFAAAPKFLQVAMSLALQTTHAVNELSKIKYDIKKPKTGVCGCVWFDKPVFLPLASGECEAKVYGKLYIHRQKVEDEETSLVAIPIGEELKAIIDSSRDRVFSPYVVHRMPTRRSNGIAEGNDHLTQLTPQYISKEFSKVRDAIGVYDELQKDERPTFHEVRALSAYLFAEQNVDPQQRMAHKNAKTTEIYKEGHVEWVEVQHAEIKTA